MKGFEKEEAKARAAFPAYTPFADAHELYAANTAKPALESHLRRRSAVTLLRDAIGMEREAALCDLRGDEDIADRYRRVAAAMRYYIRATKKTED